MSILPASLLNHIVGEDFVIFVKAVQQKQMPLTAASKTYPSDFSDEEWSLVVPYLMLMKEATPQRDYPMRELIDALCSVIR